MIAGFQGIGPGTRITTLGRGGSDTSAVAWRRRFMPSVAISTPTSMGSIRPIREWFRRRAGSIRSPIEEMLELASVGAKVLQTRSVELAMEHRVRVHVRSSFDKPEDIVPHGAPPGHADL